MSQNEIDKIKDDILVLQYRMGGAEYLIRCLIQRMHPNEIKAIETELNNSISNLPANSQPVNILNESLRLLQK